MEYAKPRTPVVHLPTGSITLFLPGFRDGTHGFTRCEAAVYVRRQDTRRGGGIPKQFTAGAHKICACRGGRLVAWRPTPVHDLPTVAGVAASRAERSSRIRQVRTLYRWDGEVVQHRL